MGCLRLRWAIVNSFHSSIELTAPNIFPKARSGRLIFCESTCSYFENSTHILCLGKSTEAPSLVLRKKRNSSYRKLIILTLPLGWIKENTRTAGRIKSLWRCVDLMVAYCVFTDKLKNVTILFDDLKLLD